jgi:hypothetical protein
MSGQKPQSITLIEAIPASLYDLLKRELALQLRRTLLVQSLEEARRNVQELKATRPPFLLLKAPEVKRGHNHALATAEDAVTLVEKDIAQLDQQEPQLSAFVAYRLETHLRKTSQDYVRSLVEKRHPEDWQRLRRQFEHHVTAFQSSLAALEMSVSGLIPLQTIEGDPSCRILLAQSIANAHAFEAEIAFLNKVSDAQSRHVGPERFSLHRQLELDWTKALQELASADSRSGPPSLGQLMRQFSEVAHNARRAIHDECPPGRKDREPTDAPGFHSIQWRILRDVVRLRLHQGELDNIALETEQFLENGRIAELAHMQEVPALPTGSRATRAPLAVATPLKVAAPPPTPRLEMEPTLRLRRKRPTPPIAASAAAPASATIPAENSDELHAQRQALENEIERLRREQQELLARAKFIEDSENKLLDRTQEQQEREIMLEQRAEDLSALEKRLREAYPQAPLSEAVNAAKIDEFNE